MRLQSGVTFQMKTVAAKTIRTELVANSTPIWATLVWAQWSKVQGPKKLCFGVKEQPWTQTTKQLWRVTPALKKWLRVWTSKTQPLLKPLTFTSRYMTKACSREEVLMLEWPQSSSWHPDSWTNPNQLRRFLPLQSAARKNWANATKKWSVCSLSTKQDYMLPRSLNKCACRLNCQSILFKRAKSLVTTCRVCKCLKERNLRLLQVLLCSW